MTVVVYPADRHGCGHHRLIWPAEELIRAGHDVHVIEQEKRKLQFIVDEAGLVHDVKVAEGVTALVLQRVTHPYITQAVRVLTAKGVAVIIDVDDDLTSIDPGNPAFQALHPRRESAHGHSWRNLSEACRYATLVTATTPALIDRYAPHGRGRVLPNFLARHYYGVEHEDSKIIGWPAALHSHPNDPAVVGPAISRLVADGERFHVTSVSTGVGHAFNLPDDTHVEMLRTAVDLLDWPRALAERIGIGIAPLADTKFNAAKCIDANTRVSTRRGVIRLCDIIEGDETWHNGDWHKVIATQRELASPGYEIETKRGHIIRVTPEHRLRSGNEWYQASQLRVGVTLDMEPESWGEQHDYVRMPWPADSRRTRHAEQFDVRAFWTQTNGPHVIINETWGRLLGFIVGDGCIAHSGDVSIACDGQDQDVIDGLVQDFESIGLNTTASGKGRRWGVGTTSASLVRFLESLGVARHRGKYDYTKVLDVPDVIWRSPKSVAIAFLSGLFESDGTGTSSVSLSTKDETLARSVQRLLTALGIISRIKRHDTRLSYVKVDGTRDYTSWSVTILARELDAIRDDITIGARKRERILSSVSRRQNPGSHGHGMIETWDDEVVAIRDVFIESIDVQVDGEVLAVNGIVSHNSWLKPLELSAVGVPWVGSPSAEYKRLNAAGCGVIAKTPQDWYKMIRFLVRNEWFRREESEKGRAVAREFALEKHAWRWWEAWQDAIDMQSTLTHAVSRA